jgi:hypothetical protein
MTIVNAEAHARRSADCLLAGGSDFNPKFKDWLMTHYGIYEKFETAANMVRERGIAAYSAFVIVNVLRWRADTQGTKFSMTNTFVPDMARLYNLAHNVPFFKVSTRFANKEPQ